MKKIKPVVKSSINESVSALQAFSIHLICGLCLALGFWVANNVYSVDLISDPVLTLRVIWVTQLSVLVLFYSLFRHNPEECSYWKAVGRSLLALPVGALINALGAIAVGAPVGLQYFSKTINWSLLMSVFTFVPASAVYGPSWTDWHRIFAHTKPSKSIDYMICLPAHGAIIGAWFGAWPMPLDWERPWQEWPICVSYGAMAGYLAAMVGSVGFIVSCGCRPNVKIE